MSFNLPKIKQTDVYVPKYGPYGIFDFMWVNIQWNLIIMVTLGPNLAAAGCYIEVAFLLSGIQNHHN